MENRRGSGIFLGVVSVATLVVAIIGATFAYFSASVTANETVDLQSYEFNADIELSTILPTSIAGKQLIPMEAAKTVEGATAPYDTNLSYAMNAANELCVDPRGYLVCVVYGVTVTNGGSDELTLNGTIKTITNRHANLVGQQLPTNPETGEVLPYNHFENLTYRSLTLSEGKYTASDVIKQLPSAENGTLSIDGMVVPADDPETTDKFENEVTRYFVVYLDDPATEGVTSAQNTEMGVVYQANVTYADENGSKLTAEFEVTGAE